jgi:AcrR family transcriptional regulator
MGRVVKPAEHAARRKEILDVAQRLVMETKGYDEMAIQDVLDELGISKGAFYHYFDSKAALLEALIERLAEEALPMFIQLAEAPGLTALDKLQRFFELAGRWKTARKSYLMALLRTWYADENALLRVKLRATYLRRIGPLLTRLIRQGCQEGTLVTPHPEQAGAVTLSLIYELGDAFALVLLEPAIGAGSLEPLERMTVAYTDAVEHVLGAPAGSLTLVDRETIQVWLETEVETAPS